jgi:hypothetical protein
VDDVAMTVIQFSHPDGHAETLSMLVAVLGIKPIETKEATVRVSDLYVANGHATPALARFQEVGEFLSDHRVVHWQDEVSELMKSGVVSTEDLKRVSHRGSYLEEFLAFQKSKLDTTAAST